MKQNRSALPVIVTRQVYIFPNHFSKLDIGRVLSVNAVNLSLEDYDKKCILISQKDVEKDDIDTENLYSNGIICDIKIEKIWSETSLTISALGMKRVLVKNFIKSENCLFADYEELVDINDNQKTEYALVRQLVNIIDDAFTKTDIFPKQILNKFTEGIPASELSDIIGQYYPFSPEKKQSLISETNVNNRLKIILAEFEEEKEIKNIENKITKKIRNKIDTTQKEFLLREKLRAIREELGDLTGGENDIENIRKRVESNPYPEHIKNKIFDELKKLELVNPSSGENSVIYTYLDWLLELPWWQIKPEITDIKKCFSILNEHHWGLEKIKTRIVEHLAVLEHNKNNDNYNQKSQIICFVGPPGVGKTSLAKSIALATNREFLKISLGGVRDESEIRGHRRTYIGAMPGKIVQAMRKAKVINPLILLDEIDKMSSDFRGDPASAMLEVLDTEQNSTFSDHYLEETYDLSKVMFIATANYIEDIPHPLMDRMEILDLSSYTELEKVSIAKNYLVPKIIKAHGVKPKLFKLSDDLILHIINHYTKEAGVRQLERLLSKIARKIVLQLYLNKNNLEKITKKNIRNYLGYELYDFTKHRDKKETGVVNGLAWTPFGGDILQIEATKFEGKGNLSLTGQLGDVMKESASIALGYIKSQAKKFDISAKVFEKNDIHIHVPEGAVQKDGPSAGITLTTVIISCLKNISISKYIAMTGEITLTGKILPIGGIKEKLISADRSKIKTVFIPAENYKNLEDVPHEVLKKLDIVLVSHYKEVFDILFFNKKIEDKQLFNFDTFTTSIKQSEVFNQLNF
ncbi:endopeptidase La [symbiont of Argiope bruennichi]|uniref:endopeptidase La n=1 Tax=symbiont of Argiope bruennichi TaxID=2810479 RepID=UPI003DA40225